MPRRFYRRGPRPTINTEKHIVDEEFSVSTANNVKLLAKAVTAPSNTITTDCHRGGHIKAMWISVDVCGLETSGTLQRMIFYLMKNPGANLTPPGTLAVGSSNEKKFVIKMWSAMTMRNQEGNPPYHWEGWVKIPKLYQRMGTDDTWDFVFGASTGLGHGSFNVIYKEQF